MSEFFIRCRSTRASVLRTCRPSRSKKTSAGTPDRERSLAHRAGVVRRWDQVVVKRPLTRLCLAAANAADGRLEDARREVEVRRTQKPVFSLTDVQAIHPFKDPQYPQRLLGDLRQAGFAD